MIILTLYNTSEKNHVEKKLSHKKHVTKYRNYFDILFNNNKNNIHQYDWF